jgi:predicted unusual protein kinase regulating ubiquinone biosynthesis (AarF/ABC1/UbiB family)
MTVVIGLPLVLDRLVKSTNRVPAIAIAGRRRPIREDRPMRARTTLLAAGGAAVAAAALSWAFVRSRVGTPVVATNAATRNARLAVAGARTGASYAAHRVRRAAAPPDARAELDAEHQMRTTAQVVATLGQMKGALMKIGQMVSYLDEGMPEPVREALASLQQDAPPMAPELSARVVEAELGARPERVFAVWDPKPIAAASIGQVHRARLHDGRDVAVKVQYPGVDDAIRADLTTSDLLFRAMAMMFPGLDPGPLVEELRARLVEELDYTREAENQRLFAAYYAGHPFIRVPAIVDECSTARVLTSEYVEGARFAEVEGWSQAERDRAAEAIFRFVFRSLYRLHAFNGDPHPGNYLFHGDGVVTFLDFGLVKHYAPEEVALFEELIRTMVLEHDIAQFRGVLETHEVLRRNAPFGDDDVRAYFGHFYEFVMEDAVLTMSPEYAAESVRRIFDLSGPYAHVAKASNVPPAFVVSQRINLGLHAVLARLRATANFRRIAEELWPIVDAPPSTPMGEAEAAWLATRADRSPRAR